MSTPDPTRAYIERLLALREADQGPDEATLRSIAAELGLDQADIDAAAGEHRARGERFLEHGLLDDAVRELNEALILRPHDSDLATVLAQAHAARWRDKRLSSDREAAERLARRTLARDPQHGPSYAVLKTLATRSRRWPWIAASVAVAAGALWVGRTTSGPSGTEDVAVEPSAATARAETSAGTTTSARSASKQRTLGDLPPVDLDFQKAAPDRASVQVKADPTPGLEWADAGSSIANYSETSYATVMGLVRNQTGQILDRVEVAVELQTAEGDALITQRRTLVNSLNTTVRPGDTVPLRLLIPTDARAVKARVYFEKVEMKPAPPAWPTSRPQELAWDVPRPEGATLTVVEREARLQARTLGEAGYYHTVVLEVHLEGPLPLTGIELGIRRFGPGGVPVGSDSVAVSGGTFLPPLVPGETRVVQRTFTSAHPVESYALTVTALGAE